MPKISAGKQAWFILITFSFCFFVISASTFSSLGVVIPFMVTELGWDWTTAGLGFTFLGLACGTTGYLPSITIRRWGIELTLILGLALFAVGFLVLYATETPVVYSIGCILIGMGYAFVGPVPGTYVITHFFRKRSTAFGFYYTMGGLGGVAGPLIVWLASDGLGNWRYHWLITLTLIVISVALMLLSLLFTESQKLKLPPEEDSEPQQKRVYETTQEWTFRQAIRTPQYWIICAAYMSVLLVGTTVNSFSVSHLTEIGVSFVLATTLLSTEAFCNALSRIVGGVIAEFFEPKAMLQGALLLLVVGMVMLSIGGSHLTLFSYALAIGFGFGFTFLSTTVLLIRYFGSAPYLQLFSVMNLIATVAAAAPYLCGFMRDLTGTFVTPFLLIGSIPVIVLIAVIFMHPPMQKKRKANAEFTKPNISPESQLNVVKEA
jgi:MFS family permease